MLEAPPQHRMTLRELLCCSGRGTPRSPRNTRRRRVLLGVMVICVLVAIFIIFIDLMAGHLNTNTSVKNQCRTEEIPIKSKPSLWQRSKRFLSEHGDKLSVYAASVLGRTLYVANRPTKPKSEDPIPRVPEPIYLPERFEHMKDIQEAIKYRWKGTMYWVPADGDCMVHSFSMHVRGKSSPSYARKERKLIVDHTITHFDEFEIWRNGDPSALSTLEGYRKDREWLMGFHIKAWHEARQINVVKFQVYDNNPNKIRVSKQWNLKWDTPDKPAIGLLHHGSHYYYVELPSSDELKQLPYFNCENKQFEHIDVAKSIEECNV